MNKYSHFDYLKVKAVLLKLQKEIGFSGKNTGEQTLEVVFFENGDKYQCFDVLGNLFEKDSFQDTSCFSLIYAPFEAGEEGFEPILVFEMGQSKCTVKTYVSIFSEKNKEIFAPILPLDDHITEDWEDALTYFIGKIKVVVENGLSFVDDKNEE